MKEKKLAPDNGVINLKDKTIEFTALPHPLPKAWRNELIELGLAKDWEGIEAWERRARATIGFQHQRPVILPNLRETSCSSSLA